MNQFNLRLQKIADMAASFAVLSLEKEYFPNLLKRKPEFLGPADELNSFDIFPVKQAKSAFRSCRTFKQPLFFIEPNSIDTQARLFGNLSNLDAVPGHANPEYTLEWTPESSTKRAHSEDAGFDIFAMPN